MQLVTGKAIGFLHRQMLGTKICTVQHNHLQLFAIISWTSCPPHNWRPQLTNLHFHSKSTKGKLATDTVKQKWVIFKWKHCQHKIQNADLFFYIKMSDFLICFHHIYSSLKWGAIFPKIFLHFYLLFFLSILSKCDNSKPSDQWKILLICIG